MPWAYFLFRRFCIPEDAFKSGVQQLTYDVYKNLCGQATVSASGPLRRWAGVGREVPISPLHGVAQLFSGQALEMPMHHGAEASSGKAGFTQRKLSTEHRCMVVTDGEKYMGTLGINVQISSYKLALTMLQFLISVCWMATIWGNFLDGLVDYFSSEVWKNCDVGVKKGGPKNRLWLLSGLP